jgi:mRNA-degrading endonuclease toxin of MazEF toxin-antitoxin module
MFEVGDVITVRFQFRENDRPKPRPAVIISVPAYHQSRLDAIMMAITGRDDRNYFGDCPIEDWQTAGLLKKSVAKGVIRTIEQSKIRGRLGSLSDVDRQRLKESLRAILGL